MKARIVDPLMNLLLREPEKWVVTILFTRDDHPTVFGIESLRHRDGDPARLILDQVVDLLDRAALAVLPSLLEDEAPKDDDTARTLLPGFPIEEDLRLGAALTAPWLGGIDADLLACGTGLETSDPFDHPARMRGQECCHASKRCGPGGAPEQGSPVEDAGIAIAHSHELPPRRRIGSRSR
jgi:hypothetical protein